jgi:putative transposase
MARVRHNADPWTCFHVTTRTLDAKYYLASPTDKHTFVSTLAYRRSLGEYRLFGFVVMANHVHFLIQPKPPHELSTIVQRIKSWTSRHNSAKSANSTMWERRFDDNRIENEQEFRKVLTYIHANPVRAGICEDPSQYEWSTVHNYLDNGRGLIDIDPLW